MCVYERERERERERGDDNELASMENMRERECERVETFSICKNSCKITSICGQRAMPIFLEEMNL